MGKATLKDRLNYAFDNYMSRGVIALIAGLGALSWRLSCLRLWSWFSPAFARKDPVRP